MSMVQWNVKDFVGTHVLVDLHNQGEQAGRVIAVVEAAAIDGEHDLTNAMKTSVFRVSLTDGVTIEVAGERFTHWHLVKEAGVHTILVR
jgi:hypothetical protein